ncbi:histone deacetylase family protein [Ideonella sp. A 288]|uniref:histone deacetylase family protein n=1 Tax=Ideonella sp. A 288 TaxID=1962181 RepID=UPI000B4BBAFA|nr:histone deacetylase family protein [Ideonella sp. A 288]
MDAWFTEHHQAHHGHGELIGGRLVSGFESPVRAERVRAAFEAAALGAVRSPADHGLSPILDVHDAGYVGFLQRAWRDWQALGHQHPALGMIWHAGLGRPRVLPRHIEGQLGFYSLDAGCAIVAGTWEAAYWSAQCALSATQAILQGAGSALAICRPPGHHATADAMGGYCYLNNAAIAAQALRARFARVGIVDVDYHHGNGTQAIFWRRDDVFFTSLHADPHDDYPYFSGHADERGDGPGTGHTLNLPLPAGTQAPAWLAALEQALDATVQRGCEAVVVSLGVDTFERDPISKFKLTGDDYLEIGRRLRRLVVPMLFVFEGGYATDEVGANAVSVLVGYERG